MSLLCARLAAKPTHSPWKKIGDSTAMSGACGTAAEIGMVGDEGVAFVDFVGRIVFQDTRGASRKGAHVQRQHDMLRDDFALAIQESHSWRPATRE